MHLKFGRFCQFLGLVVSAFVGESIRLLFRIGRFLPHVVSAEVFTDYSSVTDIWKNV